MKPVCSCAALLGKATPVPIALVILAVGLLACTLRPSPVRAEDHAPQSPKTTTDTLLPENTRKTAPEFSLISATGKRIDLTDYKGKVVLLDFWATWCGGCKLEIPWYMEFGTKYRQQGLAVIGVSMDDDGWKVVRPFLAQTRDPETGGNTAMKYPVVIGNEALGKQYSLTTMPMTILIDRRGNIALSHTA